MPTAYFDVDGTLISSDLLLPTAFYLANQNTPVDSLARLGRAVMNGPAMAVAELRDRRRFNELLFAQYKGISRDRMEVLGREVNDKILVKKLFPGTVDLIAKCKEAGLRVVLITGSLEAQIKHLAAHLGADRYIANRLEYKDRYATGKLMRPVVAGPNKANLIVDDARSVGHDLADCHAYSDSYSDVPMLSVVGHPSCINPSKKLRRLAMAYNWPVLDISRERNGPDDAGGVPARG